ncbi:MAG: hypothetical protein ABSH20_17060, partial [Tepidisphaeraceae bacterium]
TPATYGALTNLPTGFGITGAAGGAPAAGALIGPGGEIPWIDGGGGPSTIFDQPDWQQNTGYPGMRNTPDVSMIGDPNTGVAVFNTTDYSGWSVAGGTSLGTPMFAAMLTLVNQNRNANRLPKLGNTVLPRIYGLANTGTNSYFNDINLYGTVGTTAVYPATDGWDFATGWGSPKGNALIFALSQNNTRPVQPFSAGTLTFTGRASVNAVDPNASSGSTSSTTSGTSSSGGTSSLGQGTSLFGLQYLSFKGRARYYGNLTLQLDPVHMSQVFSSASVGSSSSSSSSSGTGGASGTTTTTVQGLVDIFGIDPETGNAAPTVIGTGGAATTTGTPVILYRNGNTITGSAYYLVQLSATQSGGTNTGGTTGNNTGNNTGTGTNQSTTPTNTAQSLTYGGSITITGSIDKYGKIKLTFINVHAYGDFDPRTGNEIGGVAFKNIFNTDTGGIVMTGSATA